MLAVPHRRPGMAGTWWQAPRTAKCGCGHAASCWPKLLGRCRDALALRPVQQTGRATVRRLAGVSSPGGLACTHARWPLCLTRRPKRAGPRKRLRAGKPSWMLADGQLERELERSLRDFVRLRTVSSDASLREDCFRGAKFLASLLESMGAARLPLGCRPLLRGRLPNPRHACGQAPR